MEQVLDALDGLAAGALSVAGTVLLAFVALHGLKVLRLRGWRL